MATKWRLLSTSKGIPSGFGVGNGLRTQNPRTLTNIKTLLRTYEREGEQRFQSTGQEMQTKYVVCSVKHSMHLCKNKLAQIGRPQQRQVLITEGAWRCIQDLECAALWQLRQIYWMPAEI